MYTTSFRFKSERGSVNMGVKLYNQSFRVALKQTPNYVVSRRKVKEMVLKKKGGKEGGK